jgi:hypothetical protein
MEKPFDLQWLDEKGVFVLGGFGISFLLFLRAKCLIGEDTGQNISLSVIYAG